MSNSQLKKHKTIKHEISIALNCEQCDYYCSSKGGLRKHMRHVHKSGPEQPAGEMSDYFDPDIVKGSSETEQFCDLNKVLLNLDTHESVHVHEEINVSSFSPVSNFTAVSMVENVISFANI